MTTAPYVELHFDPTGFKPESIPRAGSFLGSPAEALEAALTVTRAAVVKQAQLEIATIGVPSEEQLLRIMDLAWQATFWKYRKVSAPIIADAYLRAYRAADAGDVPSSVIYALADQHAEKTGEYFYTSSREALSEGYNTLVNRRVPAKAAADRVIEAYGLSPRQMRGYTAATAFDNPISSRLPRSIKARARAYIEKAFFSRVKKLSKQEEHNIDEQAKQFAWMWLQDHGRLNERAQKLWITARDERVCPTCGPLHGVKIGVNDRFHTPEGDFWTPGLHPNCRCVVRLIENRFTKSLTGTALADFNDEHPRGEGGRFGVKTRTRTQTDTDKEFARIVGPSALARTDEETRVLFQDIVSVIPPRATGQAVYIGTPKAVGVPKAVPVTAPAATAPAITGQPKVFTRPKTDTLTETEIRRAKLKTLIQQHSKTRTKPDTKTVTIGVGTKKATAQGEKSWFLIDSEDATPNRVELSRDMKPARSFESAEKTADAQLDSEVNDVVYRLTREGDPVFGLKGRSEQWQVPKERLREVVQYLARQQTATHELYPKGLAMGEVPAIPTWVVDPDGDPVENAEGRYKIRTFSPEEIARELKIDDIKFDRPHVVAVNTKDYEAIEDRASFGVDPNSIKSTTGNYGVPTYDVKPIKGKLKKRD